MKIKLTKREVKQVIRAAALIEKGKMEFSCHALGVAATGWLCDGDVLKEKYGNFYNKICDNSWFKYDDHPSKKVQEQRVMLLLMFAEACK